MRTTCRSLAIASLIWLGLVPLPANAGVDRWTSIAPDGGAVTALAVGPGDAGVLYAATETSGVFRSTDGGLSWLPARTGLPAGFVDALAIGGPDGRTLAAKVVTLSVDDNQPEKLFVSTDGGDHWVERQPPAASVLSFLAALAVSPGPAATLYLVANPGNGGALFESADRGVTWTSIPLIPPAPEAPGFADFVIAPSAPDVLYALTYLGDLLGSHDGGGSWTRVGHLPQGTVKLAVDPRDPSHLAAATTLAGSAPAPLHRLGQLAISSDGGHTWSRMRVVTTQTYTLADSIVGLAFDPFHRDTLYYAVKHYVATYGSPQSDYTEDKYQGLLFGSSDGGRSWVLQPVTQVLNGLAVVPSPAGSNTRLYAAASRDGILRSDDGGSSWRGSASGLHAAPNCSIAADPFIPRLLYVSTGYCLDENSDMGFLQGGPGQAWVPVNRGLRESTRDLDAFGIVPDPRSPGILYALTGQGLFKSGDRGGHWRPLRQLASDQDAVIALAIDPVDSRRLYALGFSVAPCGRSQCGLAYFAGKSFDGGDTWTELELASGWTYLQSVAVDPQNPEILYVTGGFPSGSYPPAANLLKSTDRGKTWKEISILGGTQFVSQLLVHPQGGGLLYAALSRYLYLQPTLAKSTDGGEHWEEADSGLPLQVNGLALDVALDPTRRSTLYAATDQGLFVSDDGGGLWTPLGEGLPTPQVSQVLVDPFDPATIYAGTIANGGLFVLTRSQMP